MLFKKHAQLRFHPVSVLPSWWNHGQHRLRHAIPAPQIQFEGVIETSGVADALFKQAGRVTKPYLLSQHNFLSVQPSAIGADSIDLAVVRYETKRLSQRPTGLRVGGIALMKDRERAYEFGIDQIRIEGRQLLGRKQSFINNSTR